MILSLNWTLSSISFSFEIIPYYDCLLRILLSLNLTKFSILKSKKICGTSNSMCLLLACSTIIWSFQKRYYDEMDNGRRNICTKCVIDGRLKHHLHTQTTKRIDWHLQLWYLQDLDEHRQDICSFYSKIRCGIELLVMIDGGWPPQT